MTKVLSEEIQYSLIQYLESAIAVGASPLLGQILLDEVQRKRSPHERPLRKKVLTG